MDDPIAEKTTWLYTAIAEDQTGTRIPGSSLATFVLTLFNCDAELSIINSIQNTNILNTDRGTIDEDGNVSIIFHRLDNILVDETQARETHIAVIKCTYNGGLDGFTHEIEFEVVNLDYVDEV
jgi:hypothetical protein